MEFNREQQQAMEHKDGPMLVLAGPGSGKTEVIIRRTRKLIQDYQVAPSSILVVTFTKAAAGQMRERFLHLCGAEKSQVTFGTFHGIFYGILRQAYGITSANIAGEEIKYQILRQILQNSSLQMEDENDLLESLAREISTVKNGRIPLSHYYSASCRMSSFGRSMRHTKNGCTGNDCWILMICWCTAINYFRNIRIFCRHGRKSSGIS